jgi:hypothetical protein
MDPILRRVQAEGALALAIGSALAGATAVRAAFPHATGSVLVLGVMLGVLGLAAGTRPNTHAEDRGLDWLAVIGTMIAMPVTIGLAWPRGVCFAFFIGPPAGLTLAVFWWSLLAPLRALCEGRAFDDPDHAAQLSGRWLAVLASVSAPLAWMAGDLFLSIVAVIVGALGLSRSMNAADRRARRARWLEHAKRGELGGFTVVPRDACPGDLEGIPALMRTAKKLDGVLVERGEAGPYRANGRPRALVPLYC